MKPSTSHHNRALREARKAKGLTEVRVWLDADVRRRLVEGATRSGVNVSRAVEMMVNDTWPVKP